MIPPAIFVLTGAGLSAESGLGTFRDTDGIWAKFRVEDYATPEAFERNPLKVLDFYNTRRRGLMAAQPNAAHDALAALQLGWGRRNGSVTLCTQNIDDLLEQAGAVEVIHMHGELKKALCLHCDARSPCESDITVDQKCLVCGEAGGMRPDVVWFGEMPYHMDEIHERLRFADLFVAIGTSGSVYPAAGFVQAARAAGIPTLEINLEPPENATAFHAARYGFATQEVPVWVAEMFATL
jgi:NAD-dependent deacetylase